MPTELHVDAAGRIYTAFYYKTRNAFHSALAIYAPGAQGNQAPYAILPIAGGFSTGIATLGTAVYVSATSRGAIDIFAPVQAPKYIGEITGLRKPAGVTFDGHGEVYDCNAGDGTVLALPPTERGSVKPDRVISVPGHRLCMLQPGFFSNGNEMAIAGDSLFVASDAAQTIYQLNPGFAVIDKCRQARSVYVSMRIADLIATGRTNATALIHRRPTGTSGRTISSMTSRVPDRRLSAGNFAPPV